MGSNDQIIAAFKKAGDKASYHYADDSAREWPEADKAKAEALAIFDAHPELHGLFRQTARGFLWTLNHERPV
jgi:hypothetical protein